MNILLAPNNDYFMSSIVLLQSLFDTIEETMDIYVIYSDLTERNVKMLNRFATKRGGSIHLIAIDEDTFGSAHTSFHITKEAYYRLLAQELLPKDLDRVLYLDVDIVTVRSLADLYNMSFTGVDGKEKYFIVCEGPGVSKKDWGVYDELDIPYEYPYFNSGVLLMNLSLLRQSFDTQKIFDFINERGENLKYHDQDVLNALFYDKVIYVDWHIYNQTILHIKDQKEANELLKNVVVIHYAGQDKPWKHDYKSWYFDLFWKLALKAGCQKQYVQIKWKRFWWWLRNKLR